MGSRVRASVCALLAAVFGSSSLAAIERASDLPVRTADPVLLAAVEDGMDQSPTFRRLAREIGTLKGIVYLEPGRCHDSMRSCMFLDMRQAGSYRLLFVRVDPQQGPVALVGSVAHELQHAVEVLRAREVRTQAAMKAFYLRYGTRISGHFETSEASQAAEVVRVELVKPGGHVRAEASAAMEHPIDRIR